MVLPELTNNYYECQIAPGIGIVAGNVKVKKVAILSTNCGSSLCSVVRA
jgi:hypothetical protein